MNIILLHNILIKDTDEKRICIPGDNNITKLIIEDHIAHSTIPKTINENEIGPSKSKKEYKKEYKYHKVYSFEYSCM